MIGIVVLISLVVLELFKHFLTRTTLVLIVILIVGLIIFLAVINSLTSEDLIKTDNEYIKTGAVIAESINEQPLIQKIKEDIKSNFLEIKDRLIKESE
jgi:hypothetical protein